MKCQEVSKLLIAYLDNEVTLSERTLIRAHLAGCDICQEELVTLSALQSRVSQFLQARVAQAAPSPQAWSRLQARLAGEARPSPSWLPIRLQRLAPGIGRINRAFEGDITMKKKFALATIAVLVIALSVMAFVPSVHAQVSELFVAWFHFNVPGDDGEIAIPGPVEFTPLFATYLPDEFQSPGFISGGGSAQVFELTYIGYKHFVTLTQSKVTADKALPAGQNVTVKGQPAVLVTGLEGTIEMLPQDPENAPMVTTPPAPAEPLGTPPAEPVVKPMTTYTDGKRLTWYVGDIRVEMLSNLSEAEMLKVAESLAPMKAGDEPPVPAVP